MGIRNLTHNNLGFIFGSTSNNSSSSSPTDSPVTVSSNNSTNTPSNTSFTIAEKNYRQKRQQKTYNESPSSLSLSEEHPYYKGYYSAPSKKNGGSSSSNTPELISPSSFVNTPTNIAKKEASYTNIILMSPSQFDRYPIITQHQSSSSATNSLSSSSVSLLRYNNSLKNGKDEAFFSPFGGYPTTSFPLSMDEGEDDDFLHNPDPEEEARLDRRRAWDDLKNMNTKTFGALIGILLLFLGGLALFVVLPALTFTGAVDHHPQHHLSTSNGTTSSSSSSGEAYLSLYQYPTLSVIRTSFIDADTPKSAYSRKAMDGSYWKLVFSDEFNAEGRTFYDGDDQFWTAPDIHYAATKDLEWYSPDAVTTANGTLKLRMDAYRNHNLYYRSGMLQSWNKLCFTQGILEISANLPNYGRVTGLWPGLWTMGNLARPGYLASTEGLWPYSYDSCDAGITPNQSSDDGISYLPGQRLSVCTCDGEDHPNQGVGRGAPEIDIIEGEADTTLGVGVASQSVQLAPFDIWYIPDYDFIEVYNFTTTMMNSYCGGPFQQAVSAVTTLNTSWYEFGPEAGYYQKYALEYLNDDDNGYIRWFVGDIPTFTVTAKAFHPNGNIGWRRISKEPMSIIMNLGISNNWAYIDWQSIYFPVQMSIDYVRIYQPSDAISLTCDPEDYPTYDYIQAHLNAYSNPNLTSWESAGYTFPKNILTGNCKSSKYSLSES